MIKEGTERTELSEGASVPAFAVLEDERFGRALLTDCIPELGSGEWQLNQLQVLQVRKQRRKRIVTYAIDYTMDGLPSAQRTELLAKLYGKDRGGHAHSTLTRLWEAGFRPPGRFLVPRPYGYSAARGTLVQSRAEGIPWADHLHGEQEALRAASVTAADWLAELHASGVPGPQPEDDGIEVHRFVEQLSAQHPAHSERLHAHLASLAPLLARGAGPAVPSHGDFHPKNVFVMDGRATVIDFDTFGLREAAWDIGYAIAQLLIMSTLRLGSPSRGAEAAMAFWARYGRAGTTDWVRVSAQVARTLLQSLHYELYTLRTGREELLARWSDLIELFLDSDGPEALEGLIRRD